MVEIGMFAVICVISHNLSNYIEKSSNKKYYIINK